MPAERPLAPLVVVGGSGSLGSSTFVAANLAVTLARRDLQIVLVDLDPQVSDVGRSLGLVPQGTIYDLAKAGAPYDHEKLERHLIAHPSGVKVLVGPADQNDASVIPVAFLREMYGALRMLCDVVLVIAHKLTEGVVATIDLSTCHCMVANCMVARGVGMALKKTSLCLGTLEMMGYPPDRSLLVLDGDVSGDVSYVPPGSTYDYLSNYPFQEPNVIIPSDRDTPPNYYEDVPIVAASERPAVAKAFESLADLCMRLGLNEPEALSSR